MHWLKLLKNNLNQQQFKSKHLQASYLEACFRQRFMTRRMVSRLTLGHSCSTSAIPKGLIML